VKASRFTSISATLCGMDLDTGWQQALLAEIRAVAADDPRILAVQEYGSVASGEADAWSDLDVAVRVTAGTAGAIANTRWLSRFGEVWASDASTNSNRSVMRVVYADGRRVDFTVADAGRVGMVLPPTLDRLAARTTRVRFSAALAVVKAIRGDLLVATHLTLGLLRDCLELALVVRDRSDVADDVPARIASLLAGGGGTAAVLDALAGVAALYDELANVQDPAYRSDWSGLDSLLARARAAVA
jgi:Streptomycin adenylyltransferase